MSLTFKYQNKILKLLKNNQLPKNNPSLILPSNINQGEIDCNIYNVIKSKSNLINTKDLQEELEIKFLTNYKDLIVVFSNVITKTKNMIVNIRSQISIFSNETFQLISHLDQIVITKQKQNIPHIKNFVIQDNGSLNLLIDANNKNNFQILVLLKFFANVLDPNKMVDTFSDILEVKDSLQQWLFLDDENEGVFYLVYSKQIEKFQRVFFNQLKYSDNKWEITTDFLENNNTWETVFEKQIDSLQFIGIDDKFYSLIAKENVSDFKNTLTLERVLTKINIDTFDEINELKKELKKNYAYNIQWYVKWSNSPSTAFKTYERNFNLKQYGSTFMGNVLVDNLTGCYCKTQVYEYNDFEWLKIDDPKQLEFVYDQKEIYSVKTNNKMWTFTYDDNDWPLSTTARYNSKDTLFFNQIKLKNPYGDELMTLCSRSWNYWFLRAASYDFSNIHVNAIGLSSQNAAGWIFERSWIIPLEIKCVWTQPKVPTNDTIDWKTWYKNEGDESNNEWQTLQATADERKFFIQISEILRPNKNKNFLFSSYYNDTEQGRLYNCNNFNWSDKIHKWENVITPSGLTGLGSYDLDYSILNNQQSLIAGFQKMYKDDSVNVGLYFRDSGSQNRLDRFTYVNVKPSFDSEWYLLLHESNFVKFLCFNKDLSKCNIVVNAYDNSIENSTPYFFEPYDNINQDFSLQRIEFNSDKKEGDINIIDYTSSQNLIVLNSLINKNTMNYTSSSSINVLNNTNNIVFSQNKIFNKKFQTQVNFQVTIQLNVVDNTNKKNIVKFNASNQLNKLFVDKNLDNQFKQWLKTIKTIHGDGSTSEYVLDNKYYRLDEENNELFLQCTILNLKNSEINSIILLNENGNEFFKFEKIVKTNNFINLKVKIHFVQ